MGTAFDETRKFLIRKCLGIDQAADSERGSKNMNFLYFSGLYIRGIKSVRGGSIPKAPEKKKGILARAREMASRK